jgi:methionyl-tRNA synthetase
MFLQRVFAHGWWTRNGEKMSKSLGNVIDPFELIQVYGVDYLRYFLASEIVFGGDGDFSHKTFSTRINVDLANDVGNLLNRVLIFIYRNFNQKIPVPEPFNDADVFYLKTTDEAFFQVKQYLKEQNLKGICEAVINIAKQGNKYIDVQAPWKSIKTDISRCGTVLFVLAESLRRLAILLQPIIPKSSGIILDQLAVPHDKRTFTSLSKIGLVPSTSINLPSPVFPKIALAEDSLNLMTTSDPLTATKINAKPEKSSNTSQISQSNRSSDTLGREELNDAITALGKEIRAMKSKKVAKEELQPFITKLLDFKLKLSQLPDSEAK